MNRVGKATVRTAVNLLFFTVIGTAILALTYNITRELIAKSEENSKLTLINQVVTKDLYDNDLLRDYIRIAPNPQLGNNQDTVAYRGRLNGLPAVAVLQVTAPDGYSGKISMIVAINYSGSITGVRVVTHKETPGLGDYIDIAKHAWIKLFDGASHERTQEAGWRVKKDGGQFDYMAGATITPRAVVKAVHKALHYFEDNREQLFAVPDTPAQP